MKALSKTEVPQDASAWFKIILESNFQIMRFKTLRSIAWKIEIFLSKATNQRWVCTTHLLSGKKSIFRYAAKDSLLAIQGLFEERFEVADINARVRYLP